MKRIIKISLILLLVGMAVIAAVPFLKEKQRLHRLCGNTGNNHKLSCDNSTSKDDRLVVLYISHFYEDNGEVNYS